MAFRMVLRKSNHVNALKSLFFFGSLASEWE